MDSTPKPPSKSPKRFFDIVPPNKTVPNTTSRPIVVTNQPEQNDPMVTSAEPPPTPTPDHQATNETSPPVSAVSTPVENSLSSDPPVLSNDGTSDESRLSPPTSTTPAEPELNLSDIPVDLPTSPASKDVVVVHHGYSRSTVRNIITVILILIVLVVITDLLLDLNLVKLTLPHSHFFSS